MFCYALLYVYSSFAIIFMLMRELVDLLTLSSRCLIIVVWLFLAVLWVGLKFVIVVFPHTHYFLTKGGQNFKTQFSDALHLRLLRCDDQPKLSSYSKKTYLTPFVTKKLNNRFKCKRL